MKRLPITLLISFISSNWLFAQTAAVETGVEVLRERGFDILRGKRVGLITNPTGVDSHLKSTIDILFEAPDVHLVALFGPEHGVRGDHRAGENAASYTDERTKLPVYSLYGKTRKPTPAMLKGIDALVYDLQDIGCRSYTFISTMGLAMEAAAEAKVSFVVLDRPDPLGGQKVEGCVVERDFASFLGQYPIPYVYGLSCGELARFINGEGMLTQGVNCNLTVIPMKGWKRSMTFEETGLPWVQPSPHIPTPESPEYYVATGILGELGVISEGVGYTIPFQTFAAEWIDPNLLASRMSALNIKGVMFRPISFKPLYGLFKDRMLHGVQLYITDYEAVDLMGLQFLLLQTHNNLYPNKNPFVLADDSRLKQFDRVVGTDEVRKRFVKWMRYEDIKDYLDKDIKPFREMSKKYLLY